MIFGSIDALVRNLVVGTLAYCFVVALLRLTGKRTLVKMNAFDLIVTVALGSMLATIVLSKDVPFVEGAVAVALLAGLQFVVAWLAQRVPAFAAAIKSDPRCLLRDGIIDHPALRDERVMVEELKAAVRKQGVGDLREVAAVFLETDGSFSVIPAKDAGNRSALPD